MNIIKMHHPYKKADIPNGDIVLALGFFDGVHKGHQQVIKTAKKIANEKQLKLAVMTFNQHPSIVFKKVHPEEIKYLSTIERKEELIAELGVDILYEVDFTSSFASLSPQQFVDQYIVGLRAKVAVAGFDYTFGKKEVASMEHLPSYAHNRFEVVTVGELTDQDKKISSTRIREAMDQGRMSQVNELLGYTYAVPGVVIHGDARGRTLGYPTANIDIDSSIRLPKTGVYAVEIKIGQQWHTGMASIGYNITFETNRQLTVEINIFDFKKDIYGEQVMVKWYKRLRDEKKFPSVSALIEQLKQDEKETRHFFEHRH